MKCALVGEVLVIPNDQVDATLIGLQKREEWCTPAWVKPHYKCKSTF